MGQGFRGRPGAVEGVSQKYLRQKIRDYTKHGGQLYNARVGRRTGEFFSEESIKEGGWFYQ